MPSRFFKPFERSFPRLSAAVVAALRARLAETDAFALRNVTHDTHGASLLDADGNPSKNVMPQGGPFGACLCIVWPDEMIEAVGPIAGNTVTTTGISSDHAESNAIAPPQLEKLARRLLAYRHSADARLENEPTVVLVSSSEPCPTCETKIEIAARALIGCDALMPGRFLVLFGASFDDALDIAQFNDAAYADALILAHEAPEHQGNLIHRVARNLHDVPLAVQNVLAQADRPMALVVRNGQIYAQGQDERAAFDLFSTAEVCALRAACRRYRNEGHDAAWLVDGTLYTTTRDLGPLAFTEASWTRINKIVTAIMPPGLADRQFETVEAPGFSNTGLRATIASGYRCCTSEVFVFRDLRFKNLAQRMWQRLLEANRAALYNGASVSDSVLEQHEKMRLAFAAPDIADVSHAPPGSCLPIALQPRYGQAFRTQTQF